MKLNKSFIDYYVCILHNKQQSEDMLNETTGPFLKRMKKFYSKYKNDFRLLLVLLEILSFWR